MTHRDIPTDEVECLRLQPVGVVLLRQTEVIQGRLRGSQLRAEVLLAQAFQAGNLKLVRWWGNKV